MASRILREIALSPGKGHPDPLGDPEVPATPGERPGPAEESPAAEQPLDAMKELLIRPYGRRAAQIAVLRGGRRKFLRQYPVAEEGYPATRHACRMRSGSVPKTPASTPLDLCWRELIPGASRRAG